jgi:hypothetical protein
MSVEELGLGLSTVAALAVPPSGAVAINGVARGTVDDDVASRKGDERSAPLLVAKGGLSLEGDLLCFEFNTMTIRGMIGNVCLT